MEISEQPSLMAHLASIPFGSEAGRNKHLERLSAIIRNLAVSPTTRPSIEHHGYLLGAVARLGNIKNRQVQRNILSFLLSLAQDKDSRVMLARYGDGLILSLLINLMVENHTATRRRAVRVVRLLARETAGSQVAKDPKLIAALSRRSLLDTSNQVRAEASEVLSRLGAFQAVHASWHHALLMNLASTTTMLPGVFPLALISNSPRLINQLPDKERSTLVECLSSNALSTASSNEGKERSCWAIREIMKDKMNQVCNASPCILEALLQHATNHICSQLSHSTDGMRVLIFLATVADHRKRMAVHPDLLKNLISYATSIEGYLIKQDAKKAIVALVSEL